MYKCELSTHTYYEYHTLGNIEPYRMLDSECKSCRKPIYLFRKHYD